MPLDVRGRPPAALRLRRLAFSLVFFVWAVDVAMDSGRVWAAVEAERRELESEPELAVG